MTLNEMYDRLRLMPPLDYEQHVYQTQLFRKGLDRRRIGSTTHMIIEAALDWYHHTYMREIQIEQVVVAGDSDCKYVMSMAKDMRRKLGSNIVPIRVLSHREYGQRENTLRGMNILVYLDHHLINPEDRVTGPHRLVRRIQPGDGEVLLLDRDQKVVAKTTDKGVDKLLSMSSLPIYDARSGKIVMHGSIAHELQ